VPEIDHPQPTRAPVAPVCVIVNPCGGAAARLGAGLERALHEAFAGAPFPIRLVRAEPEGVAGAVARAAGSLVVVGGGDGTLAAAAGVLAGTGRRLGILPLGTRNHLARDLGLPGDLAEAARIVATGQVRTIDLGCAHERIFVNNCSIGLYASLVEERERQRRPRWLATIPAAWRVLGSLRVQRFRLEHGGVEHRVETPLLFVGNNRYSLDAGRVGTRESLSDGLLSLAAVAPASQAGLVAMALRLLAGRADPQRDFAALDDVEALTVYGHHRRQVALDGELATMKFPLHIRILRGALDVVVPPQGAA